ncbi:MAG TPA: class I SAM-dependent methyltransferase [Gemmatimonadales bacterium]|nr:class I SAM-dependent methyltransferase [Gemmatimonadales bacterium]
MATSFADHFRRIARRYPQMRSLDVRAVRRIARELARLAPARASGLRILDVGTGTGRYLHAVCRQLADRGVTIARAIGLDGSRHMLASLTPAAGEPGGHAHAVAAAAEALPLAAGEADAVLSFNALHHFALDAFLAEAGRLLRPEGLLVLYTRTPEQNRATIWGQHFAGFAERETRLPTRDQLRYALERARLFTRIRLRVAAWWQFTTLPALIRQARARHYSTFALYTPAEFHDALSGFRERVRESCAYPWAIPVRNNHLVALATRVL